MISYLKGQVRTISEEPPYVIVIAGGVGYQVNLPVYVYETFSVHSIGEGSEVELEIYYHVTERQPRPYLVGFLSAHDKRFFEQILEVEGIGPSKAITALVMPPADIAQAIEREDLSTLTRLPGIGSRAAQKMVATLRGRIAESAFPSKAELPSSSIRQILPDVQLEVIQGLIALGYRPAEARLSVKEAVKRAPETAEDAQALVREVFSSAATRSEG